MSDREENIRLKKVIYVLSFVIFLLVVGFVAYLSFGLSKLNNVVADNTIRIDNTEATVKKISDSVKKIESQSKIPGKQGKPGKDGRDGTDSVSTVKEEKATVVKEVPVKGDKGDTGTPGREIELGKDSENNTLWRYVGSKLWNPLEVVQ